MDLDDMKQAWQAQDHKLDTLLRLNKRALRAATQARAQTALRRLTWLLGLELAVLIPTAILLGLFAATHRTDARFLVLALVLLVCAVGLIVSAIRQLEGIRRLDHEQSVVTLQKQIETLRIQRIRTTKLALLLGPLLWVPVLIVLVRGMFGVDLFTTETRHWIIANLAFGVLVILLAFWASRRYGERMSHSPILQRLMRDLAGHSLNQATAYLHELEQLDRKEPPGAA